MVVNGPWLSDGKVPPKIQFATENLHRLWPPF